MKSSSNVSPGIYELFFKFTEKDNNNFIEIVYNF